MRRLSAVLLLAVLACGCARSGLWQHERTNALCELQLWGDIQDVERGTVSDATLSPVSPKSIEAALGYGGFGGAPTVGDMLVLRSNPLLKSVERAKGFEVETAGTRPRVAFLAGVPGDAVPAARYGDRASAGRSLRSIVADLCDDHGRLFLLAGRAKSPRLYYTSLKSAPTGGESISGDASRRYFHPHQARERVDIAFVALVENPQGPRKAVGSRERARLFGDAPSGDSPRTAVILARYAAIRAKAASTPGVPADAAAYSDVGELDPDSILSGATFDLYDIGRVAAR